MTLIADPLPLVHDASGVIRIGGTRVSLESFVAVYEADGSVAQLAEAFPDLTLADIHATLAYLLRHRQEIEEYLTKRRRHARATKERLQQDFPEACQQPHPDLKEPGEPKQADG